MFYIYSSNGKHKTLVDEDDYNFLKNKKWQAQEQAYGRIAFRGCVWSVKKNKWVQALIHRIILDCVDSDLEVDHINKDHLDNRKQNLRLCKRFQNQKNKLKNSNLKVNHSKFLGVTKAKRANGKIGWRAATMCNKKRIHIGYFDSEYEAALAYDIASIFNVGEFAELNLIGKHGN